MKGVYDYEPDDSTSYDGYVHKIGIIAFFIVLFMIISTFFINIIRKIKKK